MEGTTLEAGEGSGEQEARVPRAPLPEPESLSDDSRTCRPGGCHFEDSRLLRPTTAGRRTGACASTIRGQAKLRYGTVICRLVCAPQPVRVRQTGRRYSWIWFQSKRPARAFCPNGRHPQFDVRVRLRCAWWDLDGLDAGRESNCSRCACSCLAAGLPAGRAPSD